jgi:hypothetical protein
MNVEGECRCNDLAVDLWNERVQMLNESQLQSIYSKDFMFEVDDPHGHLQRMLSTTVLNENLPRYQEFDSSLDYKREILFK